MPAAIRRKWCEKLTVGMDGKHKREHGDVRTYMQVGASLSGVDILVCSLPRWRKGSMCGAAALLFSDTLYKVRIF